MKDDDCRRTVETAMRRHRALAGVSFPHGDCGQTQCPHAFVAELWPKLVYEDSEASHSYPCDSEDCSTCRVIRRQ